MRLHCGLISLAILAFATVASAQSNSNRVAVVNGQTITQEELEKAAAGELKGLETRKLQNDASLAQDKQEILQKALDELVAEKLIEAEAAKEKKTKSTPGGGGRKQYRHAVCGGSGSFLRRQQKAHSHTERSGAAAGQGLHDRTQP